jgi:leucine dehydrogenase
LTKEGAIVTIADINEEKINEVGNKYANFRGNDLYSADVDIYAPCAMEQPSMMLLFIKLKQR